MLKDYLFTLSSGAGDKSKEANQCSAELSSEYCSSRCHSVSGCRKRSARNCAVTLASGEKYTGEILAARDHSIVFSRRHGATERTLEESKELILVLDQDSIRDVILPGSSKVLLGIGAGLGIGCLGGCLIGSSMETKGVSGCNSREGELVEKQANALAGSAIGGLTGGVVGGIIGGAVSESEVVLIGKEKRDFPGLRGLARYGGSEPAFLHEMQGTGH